MLPRADSRTKVSNAIDGLTQIGHSGAAGWINCTSTPINWRIESPKTLTVDLGQQYYITYIRLHLRDNSPQYNRQRWQNGLTVILTNRSETQPVQCGQPYSSNVHGQPPTFACSNTAWKILVTLRNSWRPLQICEIEAFGGLKVVRLSVYMCVNTMLKNEYSRALS